MPLGVTFGPSWRSPDADIPPEFRKYFEIDVPNLFVEAITLTEIPFVAGSS